MPLLAFTLVAALPVVGAPPRTAPTQGLRSNDPERIAFVHARIVVSPERTIEDGTLLVEDGRVRSVGERVSVPDGFAEHDLKGRTIWPGFIDPYTEYGLADVGPLNPANPDRAPRYEGPRTGATAWNEAVHAERAWVDRFAPDEEQAAELRARGFTVVQSVKKDGVFRGRGFVASLAPGAPGEALLRPFGPHFASFDKGSSSQQYPSSLMGSIALVRQTLLDARWYAAARDKNADVEVNRALEALGAEPGPIVFETQDAPSLLRAGAISRELGVPLIHVGSNEEYERLDAVAALDQPLILPVAWPEAPPVAGYEDALDVSLAELRHWERAPRNPAALAARDVRFAFTGHGLGPDQDFLKNVRKAVRLGLDRDIALAALTTVPAELAGVADEVGTLEAGKRANFLVAEGDLLADKPEPRIVEVWIGGRRVDPAEPAPRQDYRGVWRLELEGRTWELTLGGKPSELTGRLVSGEERARVRDPRVVFDRLQFWADLTKAGTPGIVRFTLAEVAGTWTAWATLPDGRRLHAGVEKTSDTPPEGSGERAEGGEGGDERRGEPTPEMLAREQELVSRLTSPNRSFGFEHRPAREDVLVRNATIWTAGPEGTLEGADLLVRDGKIAAVGRGLDAPRGARVIDAAGKHVSPGIIDEHSHLAIAQGVNEGSHAVTAEVRIGDVVDDEDVGIYRALAGGTTAAQLLHGSANPIGGQAQVVKLRWGASPEELKFAGAPPTIKFALGENVKQSNREGFTSRYPQTRMGVMTQIEDAFLAAREYGAAQRAGRDRGVPPRRDLQLEALLEVLEGQRFVHCHSYVQSEILGLMRLAERLGFRIQTFTHILEGYKVADEMARHGASASGFSDWWAYKFEVYDAIPYNTCLMHDRGVVASVNSDSPDLIRRLNVDAGKAVLYCGMSQEEALELVTRNPAIQLRVDDRVGSLEPGKDADFVIWTGNPLSAYSRVEQTWVDGTPYFDAERDARLREADRAEREALIQKVLAVEPARGGRRGGSADRRPARPTCEDVGDVWRE